MSATRRFFLGLTAVVQEDFLFPSPAARKSAAWSEHRLATSVTKLSHTSKSPPRKRAFSLVPGKGVPRDFTAETRPSIPEKAPARRPPTARRCTTATPTNKANRISASAPLAATMVSLGESSDADRRPDFRRASET